MKIMYMIAGLAKMVFVSIAILLVINIQRCAAPPSFDVEEYRNGEVFQGFVTEMFPVGGDFEELKKAVKGGEGWKYDSEKKFFYYVYRNHTGFLGLGPTYKWGIIIYTSDEGIIEKAKGYYQIVTF
jgi:hypothetical protein